MAPAGRRGIWSLASKHNRSPGSSPAGRGAATVEYRNPGNKLMILRFTAPSSFSANLRNSYSDHPSLPRNGCSASGYDRAVDVSERVLAAAREVFAEQGLSATLADVAGRAGVGVASVYRRFANKDDGLAGVFRPSDGFRMCRSGVQ